MSGTKVSDTLVPDIMDHLITQVTEKVKEALLSQGLKGPEKFNDSSNISKGLPVQKPIISYVKPDPKPGLKKDELNLASTIDHTLLKPEAGAKELEKLCKEAVEFHFATVCVNSSNVAYVAKLLEGSSVKPIAVVGFPLGAASTSAKAFEAQEAVRAGAKEIDMVMNIGALKSRDYVLVTNDIIKVVEASKPYPVKVILETAMLTEEEKIIACVLAKISRAAFVKTSTGFGPGGATVKDVELMRRIVGPDMGVKASGGIKTTKDALAMISSGANRIGTSNGVAIVSGKGKTHGY